MSQDKKKQPEITKFIPGDFTTSLGVFEKFISSIMAVTPESRIHIRKNHVRSRSIDTGNVAYVYAHIKDGFKEFNFPDCKKTFIAIDIRSVHCVLKEFLKAFEPETDIRFSWFNQGDFEVFRIETTGNSGIPTARCQKLCLDDTTVRKDPNPPNIYSEERSKTNSMLVCGTDLINGIGLCSVIHSKAVLTRYENGTIDIGMKEGLSNCKYVIHDASENKEPAQAAFSIDYLKDMAKAFREENVTLLFSKDRPLEMIMENKREGLKVRYDLAPCVADDDQYHGEW